MHGGRSPGAAGRRALLRRRWTRGRLVRRDLVTRTLALALLGAAVVAVLGWLFDGDEDGDRVDDLVEGLIAAVLPMGRGLSRALGEFVADLGSPVSTVVFLVAAAVFAHLRCGPRALALVLSGPPIAMILTSTVLKPMIGRTRGDDLAFPSGHTTSVTSIAVALLLVVLSIPLTRPWRRGLIATLVAVPLAVAVCLVGRDYHYPSDTLGAMGVAVAVVLVTAVVVDAMADSMADAPLGADPRRPIVSPAEARASAAPTERLATPRADRAP